MTDPELAACMAQDVQMASVYGVTDYGDPQYVEPVFIKARVEPMSKVILGANGEEVMTTHRLFTETKVDMHDRLWLPGDDTKDKASARLPQRISVGIDEDGSVDHYEVWV